MTTYMTVWEKKTWAEFLAAGGAVYGLPARYEKMATKIGPGDRLLCYQKSGRPGTAAFIACLEVTGPAYYDTAQIWEEEIYPVRLPVKITLHPRGPVLVESIKDRLQLFARLQDPKRWGNHFHQSIRPWPEADADVIVKALGYTRPPDQ